VARRTATLDVACGRCDRRGRYSTARLVQRHGERPRPAGEVVQQPAPGTAWRPSAPPHRGTGTKARE
jgi:hypothetical protein